MLFFSFSVWLCLSVCWIVGGGQSLGLYEGDVCKNEKQGNWTCKTIMDCPKAVEDVKNRKNPVICSFSGTTPVVCCETAVKNELTDNNRSKAMCEKYAESVFIRLPDELSEGGIRTYDTCGINSSYPHRVKRIIDGTPSQSREYPHMALLGYYEKKIAPSWLCGGSLISERFVLTTCDCARGGGRFGPPKVVRLGDFNVQSEKDEDESVSQPTEYGVAEVILHPDFQPPGLYNDIALLQLNKDVFFTEFIRPICLQTDHQIHETHALATGWGKTKFGGEYSATLQTVNLAFFTYDDCKKEYENYGKILLKDSISEMTMICAGDKFGNKDSCQGDSGGPLQILLEKPYCMYSQVGITSFGSVCGIGKPGIYTRVSAYVPWIESIVWP